MPGFALEDDVQFDSFYVICVSVKVTRALVVRKDTAKINLIGNER